MLAKRLSRRGEALSGSAMALAVSQSMASATVPPTLVSSTVKIGALVVAGKTGAAAAISAKVAALTEGVVKGMLLTKLKTMAAVLLAGFVCAGAMFTSQVLTAESGGAKQGQAAGTQPKDETSKDQAHGIALRPGPGADLKIKQLLVERLAILKQLADATRAKFLKGEIAATVRLEDVMRAYSNVFSAELELCESEQERLAIYEKALAKAKEFEREGDRFYPAGRGDRAPFFAAVANRLEAEIAYEREKAKATKEKQGPTAP